MAAGRLTPKQYRFVQAYARLLNGSKAAIEAGYAPRSARITASQLLTNPNIRAAVDELIEMPADEVKARVADIARGDIADLLDITPTSYSLRLMEDGKVNPKTKLIRKIKQKVTTILGKSESAEDREIVETEIELYSALEALRDIGRMHAMFTERIDANLSGSVNLIWKPHKPTESEPES